MARLMITGDFSPTAPLHKLVEEQAVTPLFGTVTDFLKTADRIVCNLECALTDSEVAIRKFGPNLKAPPSTARLLKEIGVTDCGISNNHIFDFGEPGLRETIRVLDEAGIRWVGAGESDAESRRIHFFTLGGKRIALLAVCEHEYSYALPHRLGANPYDPYDTMDDIRAAKKQADFVILLYHGGKEHCAYPSPRLRKLCQAMARNGADAVLCQHSHCIGCYEKFEGAHLLYGQGNFHFVMDYPFEGWRSGLIAVFEVGEELSLSFEPVVMTETGITLPQLAERTAILESFAVRSAALKTDEWRAGWHDFCEAHREQYESPVARAVSPDSGEREREHFSHYLDCEAHTDVWRELFPTWHRQSDETA